MNLTFSNNLQGEKKNVGARTQFKNGVSFHFIKVIKS